MPEDAEEFALRGFSDDWICWWRWILARCVAGVVLPHVVWDDQEYPVEVTVVGDM